MGHDDAWKTAVRRPDSATSGMRVPIDVVIMFLNCFDSRPRTYWDIATYLFFIYSKK